MVVALAVLFAAVLAVPAPAVPAPAAPHDSTSADLAKQLAQLLDDKKPDAISAADADAPGLFGAALFFPGTPLPAVSAKFSAPSLLNGSWKKDYRRLRHLSSASVAGSKVFVMDTFATASSLAEGMRPPTASTRPCHDVVRRRFQKAKLSEAIRKRSTRRTPSTKDAQTSSRS